MQNLGGIENAAVGYAFVKPVPAHGFISRLDSERDAVESDCFQFLDSILSDILGTQKVTLINEVFARKFGLDPREAVGKWMSSNDMASDLAKFLSFFPAMFAFEHM